MNPLLLLHIVLQNEALVCSAGKIASSYQQYDGIQGSGFLIPGRIPDSADKPAPPDCCSRDIASAAHSAADSAERQTVLKPPQSPTARTASYGTDNGHTMCIPRYSSFFSSSACHFKLSHHAVIFMFKKVAVVQI
jgi:hypothetical protein